jgi:Predicted flavin-nucleotide-binding protein
MRRKDREKSTEFALSVIDKCEYASFATVNEDGSPYCVNISVVRIENSIYFHCAMSGQKIDNMRRNNKVCLSCVGDTFLPPDEFTARYESAVVFGTAFEVVEYEEKITALKLLCEKYTPTNMADFENHIEKYIKHTAVWKIQIDKITGKSSF